ncbi:MAG: hypothetical protein EXQ79_07850 [Acidimicrobiia bacterium]|nr:hypothetical protein [Acidimicrobiia bacterium]
MSERDADSRHLMIQVNREPATQRWYVDTMSDVGTLSGEVFQTNEADPNECTRWSEGDASPTLVAQGITAADW